MSQLDDLIDRVHELANEAGWRFRICAASESTVSVYLELSREVRGPDDTDESIEDYGMTGLEEIGVRISDHGNAHYHEGERFHVRMDLYPDGDLERLRERLSRPPK
jgi:hypothetical protein